MNKIITLLLFGCLLSCDKIEEEESFIKSTDGTEEVIPELPSTGLIPPIIEVDTTKNIIEDTIGIKW